MPIPTLRAHDGGRCCWPITDRDGYLHPCYRPSSGEVIDAPWAWRGIYCERHIGKAMAGAIRAAQENA